MSINKPTINTNIWTNGVDGVVEPSPTKKANGFGVEKPPYQFFNWFWFTVSTWINYFSNLNFTTNDDGSFSWQDADTFSNDGINTNSYNCVTGSLSSSCENGSINNSYDIHVENSENFKISFSKGITFKGYAHKNTIIENSYSFRLSGDTEDARVINSSSLTIGSDLSKITRLDIIGSDSGSVYNEDVDIENIAIINSTGFGVSASNSRVENSHNISLDAEFSSILNSKRVTLNPTAIGSSLDCASDYVENQPNTKTVDHLRILKGQRVRNNDTICKDVTLYALGSPDQKLFGLGLRDFLDNSTAERKYYYADGTGEDWREESHCGSNSGWLITGGEQNGDGVFNKAVKVTAATTFPFMVSNQVEVKSHMVSFWIKIKDKSDYDNDGNIATFGAGLDYGWEINQVRESSSPFFGQLYFKERGSAVLYYIPDIRLNQYSMITVLFTEGQWRLYLNGDFYFSVDVINSSVDQSFDLDLRSGYIGSETSTVDSLIADVCYIESVPNAAAIKQLYCGGFILDEEARAKISELSTVKLLVTDYVDYPTSEAKYMGILNNTFLAIEYPDYFKDENYTVSSNALSIFVLHYLLEL